jgi:hypothetical protein
MSRRAVLVPLALLLLAPPTHASGVVSQVKVLSDKVPDVSSLEAWKRWAIHDGMTDRDKALAIWKTVVTFQYQDNPPKEFLQNEDLVLDTVKLFNVYGYSFCGVAASHVQCLARYLGLQARGWTIRGHVVPEVFFDGGWHMLDGSLINYFPKPDGSLAGVEEIVAAVKAWHAQNPGFFGNNNKLMDYQRRNGWSGWRQGPALLAACPFYDAGGWWPAGSHGWYSTMQEYDGSTLFPYSCGFSQGYRVNIQLRPGERLTRNWSNQGLQINRDLGDQPGCLTMVSGQGLMRHTPAYGDLAPGRIGNGSLTWAVPLDQRFHDVTLSEDSLATKAEDGRAPELHLKPEAKDGQFVLRLPSSYVYLKGQLSLEAKVAEGGSLAVDFSDNNGLDWREVKELTASGPQTLDLSPLVLRRYDYRLRFTLKGQGTGLDKLAISHVIQHSQRPLPALGQGANQITFSSAAQEGTVTVEGSTNLDNKKRQVVYKDFHPTIDKMTPNGIRPLGTGSIVFPIATPGDMTRLRTSTFYRARDAKDAWEVAVSWDNGATWQTLEKLTGPGVHLTGFTPDAPAPPGTRQALVKWTGTERNTAVVFNFRIDADYAEPKGAFAPVKITYRWQEDRRDKEDVHVAKAAAETYSIDCGSTPKMTSITLELAE